MEDDLRERTAAVPEMARQETPAVGAAFEA